MPEPTEPAALWRGRVYVLIAASLWSTSGFFAQAPFFEAWPVEQRGVLLACWRALVAGCVMLPFVRRVSWSPVMPLMLLAFVAMNFTFMSALTLTSAANAIWLQFISPVWVFVIGVFFLGESRHARDWMLISLAGAGVLMIVCFESQGAELLGVAYGLLSGVTLAGVILCLRQLRGHDAAWLIALNHLVCAAVFFPYVVAQDIWPTGIQWPMVIGFGALQMGIPYLLFAHGLKSISGHEASGIGLIEPILVPLWVYLAWSGSPGYRPPDWWTFVGGGLILIGLVLRYGGRTKRQPGSLSHEQLTSPAQSPTADSRPRPPSH
jgi:drug/metabolite transporter (DMT)-like permease